MRPNYTFRRAAVLLVALIITATGAGVATADGGTAVGGPASDPYPGTTPQTAPAPTPAPNMKCGADGQRMLCEWR